VHHRDFPGEIIAEPTPHTIERFEHIVESILNPPRVIPLLHRKVDVFDEHQLLSVALKYVQLHDYSQIVVAVNGRLRLVTEEAICRWLEAQMPEDIISIAGVSIADVIQFERRDVLVVIDRNRTLAEALWNVRGCDRERTAQTIWNRNHRFRKGHSEALGIITPWDLIQAREERII